MVRDRDDGEQEAPRYLGGGEVVGAEVDRHTDRDYSVAKFYLAVSDGHGHNREVRTNTAKFPTYMYPQIVRWVQDDRTPYRSPQDLIRDAVVHRLYQLDNLEEVPPENPSWALMAQLSHERQLIENWEEELTVLREECENAIRGRDGRYLASAIAAIRKLAEEAREPYRSNFEDLLNAFAGSRIYREYLAANPQHQEPSLPRDEDLAHG